MEPKTKPEKKPKHVHRMVSLPPELDRKAGEMENFSQYVRSCMSDSRRTEEAYLDALKRKINSLKECLRIARDRPASNAWIDCVEAYGWTWDEEAV